MSLAANIAMRCLAARSAFALMQLLFVIPAVAASASARDQQTGARFTSLAGFRLGAVTLNDIQRTLGPARLTQTRDAGEYEASLCYRTPDGAVRFLSGEMGGSEHTLLGFRVMQTEPSETCSPWPPGKPTKLDSSGLRMGMSKQAFVRALSTVVEWSGNTGRATFESRRPLTKPQIAKLPAEIQRAMLARTSQNYFDVVVSIVARFEEGKLIDYEAWKVESL